MTRRYPLPNSQPIIPIKTYRFYFSTERPIRLPGFAGSAWRGAFGHALKKTVCVVRNTPCNQCLLKNACAYSVVFETPPPANAEKMRKYTAEPLLRLDLSKFAAYISAPIQYDTGNAITHVITFEKDSFVIPMLMLWGQHNLGLTFGLFNWHSR